MASCVFCGGTDNITTSMNVKTSRGESTVHVCAEHEDNASPKKVRELVEGRETALAEMEEKCRALGFTMVPVSAPGQISIVKAESAPVPAAQVLSELRPVSKNGSVVRSESRIIQPVSLKVRDIDTPDVAVDKSGKTINLGKEKSYDVTKTVSTRDGTEYRPPVTVESELQIVEGRAGVPIKIPKRIVDDTGGKTDFKVLPTAGSSQAFEKRFKDMADRSIANQGPDFTDKGRYEEPRPCNFCDGTGKAKIGNQACPRCKGVGEIA
jgi:RecJ-like exonuclease